MDVTVGNALRTKPCLDMQTKCRSGSEHRSREAMCGDWCVWQRGYLSDGELTLG